MFNNDIKERFIKEYTASTSVTKACLATFNAFEQYEVDWNADLCTKSSEELQPVIDKITGMRSRSKFLRLTILREYVRWCISNGVKNACDGLLQIKDTGVEKLKQQTVTSPLHLQMYLNSICEPEVENTTDNIYRCFYWLAYGGASEDDALQVKTDEVDFSNMLVKHGNKEYPIYREAIPAFKRCAELDFFVYKHPNYSADKVVYKARADGDTLVRGIRSAITVESMRVELSRRSKRHIDENKTTLRLSYYRVWLSGLFYRVYEMERAGIRVDFMNVAEYAMEGKKYKSERDYIAKQKGIANEYLHDYERWKLTFN